MATGSGGFGDRAGHSGKPGLIVIPRGRTGFLTLKRCAALGQAMIQRGSQDV
ncbi:MAG: hypothetical protein H5U20_10090 [Rhodobacteraceae bacterium]|nr:hypothetical protein [Paracoccaceae bacterium]